MEVKEIKDSVDEVLKGLNGKIDEKMQGFFENKKEALVKQIDEKGFASKDEMQKSIADAKDTLESAIVDLKKSTMGSNKKAKSFEEALGSAMKESTLIADIKNGKSRGGNIQLKAEADEDLNFSDFGTGAYDAAVQGAPLRGDIQRADWLRNFLPNLSTTLPSIRYLREGTPEGAAGVWDGSGNIDTLTNKPGVSPTFTLETVNVDWIAGITRVPREMLDDIVWLRGYLNQMLLTGKSGLFVAENTLIYNALTDASNSTAYDGSQTGMINMIYDAAFGQLKDNRHNPTVILANNRDVVNEIALHQATGSGEYDLPPGLVNAVGGNLSIGGVPVIGTTDIPTGNFIALDGTETAFVSRMSPEVRFFAEDRDNVPKNLITVRAEERAAVTVYDETAVITGSF